MNSTDIEYMIWSIYEYATNMRSKKFVKYFKYISQKVSHLYLVIIIVRIFHIYLLHIIHLSRCAPDTFASGTTWKSLELRKETA